MTSRKLLRDAGYELGAQWYSFNNGLSWLRVPTNLDGCTDTMTITGVNELTGHVTVAVNRRPTPATSPSSLTFVEAMALDPSEVEVREERGYWRLLADCAHTATIAVLRTCAFRRARPRRSRVQEMAEHLYLDPPEAMSHAIRAVCEYLRTHPTMHPAADIEREFLEER